MMRAIKANRWGLAVGALYAVLSGVYLWLGLWRYGIFRAGVDDGIFAQIASSSFGTFSSTQEAGANHLLVHFSPILVLAWPFVEAFGAKGLIVLQALLSAGTIFPVWGIARRRLPAAVAFVVALVAACYPPLSGEAVGDFHELAFTPVLAAAMVWALDGRSWRWAIAFACALALVKEDQLVALAFIGAAIALTAGSDGALRRCGLWIAAIGIAVGVAYFAVLRPLINPAFPYWSFHFYQWWWNPPTPNGFVAWNSPVRLQYLLGALAPLAFLPLLSRRYIVFVVPGMAEVMLSHEAITLVIGLHYSATWSGYMLCAFADGAGALAARSMRFAATALAVALGVSVLISATNSPIIPGWFLAHAVTNEDRLKDASLAALPRDAGLYVDAGMYAHVGTDPNASVNLKDQQYLIFDAVDDLATYKSAAVQQAIAQGHYAIVSQQNGLIVLRRP